MAVALPVVVLTYTIVSHRDLTIAEFVRDTRGYLFWLAAAALALRFRGPIQRGSIAGSSATSPTASNCCSGCWTKSARWIRFRSSRVW